MKGGIPEQNSEKIKFSAQKSRLKITYKNVISEEKSAKNFPFLSFCCAWQSNNTVCKIGFVTALMRKILFYSSRGFEL